MTKKIVAISNNDPEKALDEYFHAEKSDSEIKFTKDALQGRNLFKENILHIAIKRQNIPAIRKLMELNFDPYLKAQSGRDAFDYADDPYIDPIIKKMLF